MFLKKTMWGGGLVLCLIAPLVLGIIPYDFVKPAHAASADPYGPPACLNQREINETPAPLPDFPEIGAGLNTNGWYSCDNGVYMHTDQSETLITAKRDGGWRYWFKGLPTGRVFTSMSFEDATANENGILGGGQSDGKNYAVRPIKNLTWSLTKKSYIYGTVTTVDMKATSTENVVMQAAIVKEGLVGNGPNLLLADGNGGSWGEDTYRTPLIHNDELSDWTAKNTPTRTGYTFTGWSTDAAGQHPIDINTGIQTGMKLYAQWEKASGDPQSVDLDCSTGGRCELTVNYSDSPAKTREFQPGSGNLSWPGTPISGVLLDSTGYAADGACSDARCWYVSLEKAPQSPSAYQAQMPTTGAPEGLSSVGLVAFAVGLVGLMFGLARRVRD